jgi:hypothetical protein
MKKLLFITLFLVSFASFGQRVLTAEEKESLKDDPEFIAYCQWAARDYAAYWSVHDGAGLNTESARIKWVKDRYLSIPIVTAAGDISDPTIALQYLKVAKGMTFTLGTAPQPNDAIIDAILAANKFEEMTSLYFDVLGETVNFSLIGN